MHPQASVACDWSGISPAPEIFAEQSLRQAFLSLLNNAVDASPQEVSFAASRQAGDYQFSITDRGLGVSPGDLTKLGRTFFTTKRRGKGAGLGLVLAARAIQRLGGTLTWDSAHRRGTCARIVLPSAALQLDGQQR
jgi:signal transduction histidine kinase